VTIFEDLYLSVRWVDCDCGVLVNRDVNAAKNILKRALQNRVGQARWELTWAVAPCVSQEATALSGVWSVTKETIKRQDAYR
jgi:transposase